MGQFARMVCAVVVLALGISCATQAEGADPARRPTARRWLFVMRTMRDAREMERTIALFPQAKAAGYNAVVLSDRNLYQLDQAEPSYLENVRKLQQAAFSNGLDLIPCVMPIGYSGAIVGRDPNLAEGIPVKDALLVVQGREARLVADPAVSLAGDFEQSQDNRFAGWEMQDNVGASTFADHDVLHGGHTSVRMENISQAEPKWGHSRFMQRVKVSPWRQYHLSAWVKTQDFEATESPRLLALAPTEQERDIGDLPVRVQRTQDWKRYDLLFNSLSFDEVRIYFGCWGGKSGRIWWDDVQLEEVGLLNPLRREGCPVSVRGENGTAYQEGKDFESIRDPQLAAYYTCHESLPLRLTADSRIPEGARLRVSYYHPMATPGDQVMCCLSDPKVYDILRDQVKRVDDLLHPKVFFMQHDEIRVANWDQACQSRHLTPGQILADNARRCVRIIRDLRPDAEIWVWSDMFDPMHNAVDNYYAVNGTWAGSWEGLPAEVGIVNWYGQLKGKNAPFFA
ncbi:MAG: hypothetical protein AB1505_36230, partial [Candidatus Latescibacterota bacterium]